MDCFFYEAFKEEEKLLKEFLPSTIKAGFTSKTIQECGHKRPFADLISIRTQSNIPDGWANTLKGILTRSVGYDHLLAYQKCTGKKMACGYLPTYCARSVAEHAIMMALALSQKLKNQLRNFDTFNRDNLTGSESQDRCLLVVGVGNIGSQIVDIGKGLRMHVKGVDIDPKLKDCEYISLADGVSWADIITCALPLTTLTKNMLAYNLLKNAKPGCIFINIGRGEISPVKDLKRLLDEEVLGGLGLDVFEGENALADYLRNKKGNADETIATILELKQRDNCLFTPHNAFNTQQATKRKAKENIEAIGEFLKTGNFPHPIPEE